VIALRLPRRPRLADLRQAKTPAWWLQRTEWTTERPWLVVLLLALLGLLVRHAWITTLPLSSGDWHWFDRQRIAGFFPWPSIWDSSLGLGGENRFLEAFRFPVYALSGLLAQLGAGWSFIEKALYVLPYAVLLPVAGWLLAREIMGRTRWALMAPLILLGSTYFMINGDSEPPLALAEAITFLSLLTFLRAMRRRSIAWAATTGLLIAVTAAYDIRPAYLGVVLMAMYFVVLALAEPGWRLLARRALLGLGGLAVFAGTQAFWLLPLLTYHGATGFPIPQAPNFTILTLGHGLSGTSTFWTGGEPALLVQAPLNPIFMILPLLALTPLVARRVRPEVVWLSLAALLFAFFAKTDTAPLGGLYDWMYRHIPGWNLFREGSKFLYPVTLAYAILIPTALRAGFAWASSLRGGAGRILVRSGAAAALAGVVVVSCFTVGVLESGSLDVTTNPAPEPASFAQLSSLIDSDPIPGAIAWFGQPVVGTASRNRHFVVASPDHPVVNLTGELSDTRINHRDPFQLYCADGLVPYCYANSQLFPYLTRITGTRYVVAPAGRGAGSLPFGITPAWLRGQLSALFGAPRVLGSGETALLVWTKQAPAPAVTSGPAVALVDSGTWATGAVLPALQALDIPTAYRQSYSKAHNPPVSAGLPDSIRVLPRLNSACVGTEPVTAAVMAQSSAATLDLSVAGTPQTLERLASASRLPGWGFYGPVQVASGAVPIAAAPDSGLVLGPCVAWSEVTALALAPRQVAVDDVSTQGHGEQVAASISGSTGPWIELHRYYDLGWKLRGEPPTALGDGLFNLYHVDRTTAASPRLTFSFSTILWERAGEVLALLALVAALLLVWWDLRRRRVAGVQEDEHVQAVAPPSVVARWIGAAGLVLVAAATVAVTLEWFGVPSSAPLTAVASDPYAVDVGYAAAGIALLVVSLAVRLVIGVAGARRQPAEVTSTKVAHRLGTAAAIIGVLGLLITSCAPSGDNVQALLGEAQRAGALAPSIAGSSLDDARLQSQAANPGLCITDYTEALKDFPDLVKAYAGRASCYVNGGGNAPAAVHDYAQAISLSPNQSDLYLRRAAAERISGDVDAAVADYEHAATVPSATATQLLIAVDGLLAVQRYDAAAATYAKAAAIDPTSPALHLAAANLATATGDDARAAQEYARAEQLVTGNSQLAVVLTHECHQEVLQQQYTRATTDCANAARLSSFGSAAYDDLAAAELALGDPEGALSELNASIGAYVGTAGPYAQSAGVDGYGLANLAVARAWIEIQLHQRDAALADLHRALDALPPGSPNFRARIKDDILTIAAD
jgi:tetratricopeptide (TPR) repeat protein